MTSAGRMLLMMGKRGEASQHWRTSSTLSTRCQSKIAVRYYNEEDASPLLHRSISGGYLSWHTPWWDSAFPAREPTLKALGLTNLSVLQGVYRWNAYCLRHMSSRVFWEWLRLTLLFKPGSLLCCTKGCRLVWLVKLAKLCIVVFCSRLIGQKARSKLPPCCESGLRRGPQMIELSHFVTHATQTPHPLILPIWNFQIRNIERETRRD